KRFVEQKHFISWGQVFGKVCLDREFRRLFRRSETHRNSAQHAGKIFKPFLNTLICSGRRAREFISPA
ncbi:MAG: hypothetical protein AB7H97_19190, partial [Pseudobdellovibrionaceae bacterium]